jgi:hypothetical protein
MQASVPSELMVDTVLPDGLYAFHARSDTGDAHSTISKTGMRFYGGGHEFACHGSLLIHGSYVTAHLEIEQQPSDSSVFGSRPTLTYHLKGSGGSTSAHLRGESVEEPGRPLTVSLRRLGL